MNFFAASVELSNMEMAIGVLSIIAMLIGHHFLLTKYIRDTVGVKESSQVEISGQPISVQKQPEWVDRDSYNKHCELNRVEHERINARIAAVELKREQDKEDIINAGNQRAEGTNRRIEMLIEKVGQLTGKMEEVAKRVQ